LLLIVNLSSKENAFPMEALKQVDDVLAKEGFRKEVRSVLKPGKEFSVTYDGPSLVKSRVEEMLKQVMEQNKISFSVESEESVKFP
jgi:hypothetical protein